MPLLSQYDLTGKTAILSSTGGDEAPLLASVLAEAGATVFAVTRREENLNAILDALDSGGRNSGSHGGVAIPLVSDEAVARAMAEFDRLERPVDILVNDNRSMLAKPAGEITLSEWDEVQSRNVRTAFLLSQAVGRRMVERESGRIVNIISGLAERGMIGGSAFSVSQAGLLALTRSLAVEWGRHNIRVNAIGVRLVHRGGRSPGSPAGRAVSTLHPAAAERTSPGYWPPAGLPVFRCLRLHDRPAHLH